jgi:outer membrane protein assembly factor BamE (lipoprotein component of BamABCDE complex)
MKVAARLQTITDQQTACLTLAADIPVRVKILFAALVAIAIAGCSSIGTPIAQEKVNQIRLGVTTEPDLLLLFGNPSTKTLDPSGAIVMTWVYSSASTKPETFVPLAGPFIGGYHTQLQQLTVLLNRKGRVERWTMNNSPGEVRYGRTR